MKKFNLIPALLCLVAIGAIFLTPAMATPRDTIESSGQYIQAVAGETISQGELVLVRTDGKMWRAVDSATNAVNAVIGRAENTVAIGETCLAKQGCFLWRNQGSITSTSLGATAYAMSSTGVTTAAIATNDVAVGKIVGVATEGIWVKTEL